jgi:hypothetical protein
MDSHCTRNAHLRSTVFQALNNAVTNGYDISAMTPGEIAFDPIQCDADLENVPARDLVPFIEEWKTTQSAAAAMTTLTHQFYKVARVGRYDILEGAGTAGGLWLARGRGECVRYGSRREAEDHAHASNDRTCTRADRWGREHEHD